MNKLKVALKFLRVFLLFPLVWLCAFPLLVYYSIALLVYNDYGFGRSERLHGTIVTQKSVLEVIIRDRPKDQVIESVKNVLDRPENRHIKLRVSDDAIVFGKTKILLQDGKAIGVQ